MLRQDHASDYVIANGEQYSVRQFVTWTAENLGLTRRFEGEGEGTHERAVVAAIADGATYA